LEGGYARNQQTACVRLLYPYLQGSKQPTCFKTPRCPVNKKRGLDIIHGLQAKGRRQLLHIYSIGELIYLLRDTLVIRWIVHRNSASFQIYAWDIVNPASLGVFEKFVFYQASPVVLYSLRSC
jgi:hypothetical protein